MTTRTGTTARVKSIFSRCWYPNRMACATMTVVVGPGMKPPASPKTQPDAITTRTSIIADSQCEGVDLRRASQNRKGINILVFVI